MIAVPVQIANQFDTFLAKHSIPENVRAYYLKWLRYYWDFFHKYHFDPSCKEILSPFLQKLQDKKQSEPLRKQAYHAVSIYYELGSRPISIDESIKVDCSVPLARKDYLTTALNQTPVQKYQKDNNTASRQKVVQRTDKASPDLVTVKQPTKQDLPPIQTGASWVWVFDRLRKEIKLRHYSPKTLKAYSGWTRKFHTYTRSKEPEALGQHNVIDFLSDLAVEKKVSASSQNQAFNALLFLFRQVLNKEFGEIKGVARAKRRPYIPIVLSRDEIDSIITRLVG